MKEKAHNPQPLLLSQGYATNQSFSNIDEMLSPSDNWEHHCTYQLLPHGIVGQHKILQLDSMQITYGERLGGLMNDIVTAKDCFTFAVIEESEDKMCLHRTKLKAGDIIFFDDSQAFSFIFNGNIKFCVVNIKNESLGVYKEVFLKALQHTIKDTDAVLSKTLRKVWKEREKLFESVESCQKIELETCEVLRSLLKAQIPQMSKLTKGEEIALDIRNRVYAHMDGKINIKDLAREYQVSERSLQHSFKSLFGFAPVQFLRILKLNHIHHELKRVSPQDTSVSKVATKWGFTHLGYFSKYYTDLFGENPSTTLKTSSSLEKSMDTACALRQEEM